ECQIEGIDGNQIRICPPNCSCLSSHSSDFIYDHDIRRIEKEIGQNRLTKEDIERLEKGFTPAGLASGGRLYKEVMERREGPVIEKFPWVNVRNTKGIGLGLYATCDIPKNTIICPYTARLVTEEENLAYISQVEKDRMENTDGLLANVDDYQTEVDLHSKSHFLEGFRQTHRGVITLGRYANSTSCSLHLNAQLRRFLVRLRGGEKQFLALFVSTRAIAADEPILWLYDSARPSTFPCPCCPDGSGSVPATPTDGPIRMTPIFGPDFLPERSPHVLNCSFEDQSGVSLPYTDAYSRPLTPSDVLIAMTNRLPMMGARLTEMGEYPVGSSKIEKIIRRAKKLLATGSLEIKAGLSRFDHSAIYRSALSDSSNRLLLLIFHNGKLTRALAVCPPSSSSFRFGSILISRVTKRGAKSGVISVLGLKCNQNDEDRSIITSILKSTKPIQVIDRLDAEGKRELYRFD
ncbi:hypothetical protein PENTCL1PPCAC_20039, partial [Pristionchus entomophagus]